MREWPRIKIRSGAIKKTMSKEKIENNEYLPEKVKKVALVEKVFLGICSFQLYEDTFPCPKRKEKEKLPDIKKKEKKKSSIDTLYILELSFFEITLLSPHVRECGFRNPGNFGLWNPESWKNFVVESGILGYVIQLKESGIPGFKSRIQDYLGFPYMMQLLQMKRTWSNPFKNGTILNHPTDSIRSFTCDVIALKPRPNEHDSVKKRSQENAKTM